MDHPEPNYLREALRKVRSVAGKSGVYVLNVLHDDLCSVFRGGACNCEPEVADPQALEEMQREIAELSTPEHQAKAVPF